MGSQYLINQSLHTQPGSQDVRLSVHSTELAHLTHFNNLWGRHSTSSGSWEARERAEAHTLRLSEWLLFVLPLPRYDLFDEHVNDPLRKVKLHQNIY